MELAPARLIRAVCAEIVNVEFPKLTSQMFSAVNFAYNPVFSLSTIVGVANEIEDEEEREAKVAEVINVQHEKYKEALEVAKKAATDTTKTKEEKDNLKL